MPPLTASAEQIKQARLMFNGLCGSCHGLNAVSGGVVPDLRYMKPEQHELFAATVSGARINRGMPGFAGVLKPEDMQLLHQYVIKRTHDLSAEIAAARPAAK